MDALVAEGWPLGESVAAQPANDSTVTANSTTLFTIGMTQRGPR